MNSLQKSFLIFLFIFYLPLSTISFAERAWENKTQKENELWINEIETWESKSSKWFEKREKKLQEVYGKDGIDTFGGSEYCNSLGCYETSMFGITYETLDGKESWDFSTLGGFSIRFENIFSFESSNQGQVIELETQGNEQWESSNFGQVMSYIDGVGNSWESSNIGQVLEFKGVSGQSWESHNNGQVIEITDKNGDSWKSSNFGQVIENNGEENVYINPYSIENFNNNTPDIKMPKIPRIPVPNIDQFESQFDDLF